MCLLPQAHSNKFRLAVLEALVFHPFWCLGAQRKNGHIHEKLLYSPPGTITSVETENSLAPAARQELLSYIPQRRIL